MRQMLAGSRPDAEDALQDVFLRAYGALRADERADRAARVALPRRAQPLHRPAAPARSPAAADVFEVAARPLHDPVEEAERREDLRRLVADVGGCPSSSARPCSCASSRACATPSSPTRSTSRVPAVKSLLVRAGIGLVEAAEARDTDLRRDPRRPRRSPTTAAYAPTAARGATCATATAAASTGRASATCSGPSARWRRPAAPAPALLAKLGLGGSGSRRRGRRRGGRHGARSAAVPPRSTAGKVCAVVCSVALTAGGAVEVQREISDTGAHGGSAPAPQVRSVPETVPPPRPPDAGLKSSGAAQTAKPAVKVRAPTARTTAPTAQETPVTAEPDPAAATPPDPATGDGVSTGGAQAPVDLTDGDQTSGSGTADQPKATGAGGDVPAAPALPLTSAEKPAPPSGGGAGTS